MFFFFFDIGQQDNCPVAEYVGLLLSNLTRVEHGCPSFVAGEYVGLKMLLDVFCRDPKPDDTYASVALSLMNITQDRRAALFFAERGNVYFPKLLEFLSHPNTTRRVGVSGIIRYRQRILVADVLPSETCVLSRISMNYW